MQIGNYELFIHKSRYARWLEEEQRRESLPETIGRYFDYMTSKVSVPTETLTRLMSSVSELGVMPSMRAMMTAGPALERSNVAGFNCSYLTLDDPVAFDEALYILLCGTGVGFSVENKYISKLPAVPDEFKNTGHVILVQDSKEGWALAQRELLSCLWSGILPEWNTSLVRPKGARLKTFGGRASGPEPLIELFEFTIDLFWHARGRQLTDIECHDLMCKIGDIVVVGGVRRSAMISLSDLDSEAMAKAKSLFPVKSLGMTRADGVFAVSYVDCDGQQKSTEITLNEWELEELGRTSQVGWWKVQPQRMLSNNSAVYDGPLSIDQFSKEWAALIASKSGERGIFNRAAAREQARKTGRRDWNVDFGTNPCGEILLRPCQFCNLTESVIRNEDTLSDLRRKVEHATIMGTYQSTLTSFPYLRQIWRKNTEEERLLGVSLTGIMDHPVMSGQGGHEVLKTWLDDLRKHAVYVNAEWADRWGIPASASITCVKPSGTVSQLVNSASGIHPRHSHYYIRSVRSDNKDPITQFLKDSGVPNEACVMKPKTTTIFYFPVKAPDDSITRNALTALEHLEIWKIYQESWCEHNPSITINVRDDEWMDVGSWVFKNMDAICGISFLPHTDHVYQQAPYQEVDKAAYQQMLDRMPFSIDWDNLRFYEAEDNTIAMQTLACVAGVCEI
jgi:ribonucleoside-triphosphate reductase